MFEGSIYSLVLSLMDRNKRHEIYYQTPSMVKFTKMELLTSKNKSQNGIKLLNPEKDPKINPAKRSQQINLSTKDRWVNPTKKLQQGISLLHPEKDPQYNPQKISFYEREIRRPRYITPQEQLKSKIEMFNFFKKYCMVYTVDQYIYIKFQFRIIKSQLLGEKWYMTVRYTGVSHLNLRNEELVCIFSRYHDNLLKDYELLNYFRSNQL